MRPDRTGPGSPTQNGSHERMHADLSQEIQGKIAGGVEANQRAIDAWVEEYNHVRPHESIGMMTPSEVYTKSDMIYKGTPDTIEYPIGFETRKINKHGYVKVNKTLIQVSTALRGLTLVLKLITYPCLNWTTAFSAFPPLTLSPNFLTSWERIYIFLTRAHVRECPYRNNSPV